MSQSFIPELKGEIKTHTQWLIRAIINTVILACWAIFHYLLNKYAFSELVLVDTDAFIFKALQMLGAITTLLPILLHTVKDAVKMVVEAYDEIQIFLTIRRNAGAN